MALLVAAAGSVMALLVVDNRAIDQTEWQPSSADCWQDSFNVSVEKVSS